MENMNKYIVLNKQTVSGIKKKIAASENIVY